MTFDLRDQLTKEDKRKIENYIYLYGTKNHFMGVDKWLRYWSINKVKMYKLLGNQLIYRAPFEYNKSSEELNAQLRELHFSNFVIELERWLYNPDIKEKLNSEICLYILNCCSICVLIANKKGGTIKFKLEGVKKTLQLQDGIKPLRAISRFLTYCKDLRGADKIIKLFEEFRIAHSMILNDKIIKGNLVISIHPLDFMTMSDNNSNWQSCMSWKDGGCYRIGTVEMMNSNNVLCCYIENSNPFYFDKSKKDSENSENYRWYNKKWRQLVYFTKDIVVSGKSYPYANDDISCELIKIIRKLAKENLNWTYSFGPELYQDMKYINSSYSMNRAKGFIHSKNMLKHNIIFDSKGMYNDMLNDNYTKYWCVRNKVKHNKVISYSGKAPCLCCGGNVLEDEDVYYNYNERYSNCNSTVCMDCLKDMYCDLCEQTESNKEHYTFTLENGVKISVCEDCIRDYFRKCPDCGKTMFVTHLFGRYNIFRDEEINHPSSYIKLSPDYNESEFEKNIFSANKNKINSLYNTIFPICRCHKCAEKDSRFEKKIITINHGWSSSTNEFFFSKDPQNKADWEKYFSYNLEPAKIAEGEVIID